MKTALVTGGCGFVGRNLTRRLLAEDYCVHIVDDLSTGRRPTNWLTPDELESVVFTNADLRTFVKFAQQRDYEYVFHCAAVVGGRLRIEGDPIGVGTDLAIDSDFFNWCCRLSHMPKRIVYFSSSAVYPTDLQTKTRNMALSEGLVNLAGTRIGMPDQTYGWAKLTGELLAQHAVRQHKLPVLIFRPFSGYGEDQSADYPFPAIIRRIVNRESPTIVWGSGHQVRDFIHIDDVINCVFATLDSLPIGEPLNIGTGRGIAFRQLAETACRLLNHGGPVVTDETKPEGVHARVADIYRMQQFYVPKVSLEAGICRVANAIAMLLDKAPARV